MCVMRSGEYKRLTDPHSAGANLVGADLYQKLTVYLQEHFKPMLLVRAHKRSLLATHPHQKFDTLQDEELLRYYAQEWDRYTTGANYLNRLFTYLNRYWVKRERDEGKKTVYQVYTVRNDQWHATPHC